jgi:hypothetical protein
MARIRSVKPEYFDDPDVGTLSAEAALVFVGIWTQADRAGRLVDDPRRLKVRIRPYSTCDFDAVLAELVNAGFLIRYQSEGGARLLQVRSFGKHQKCHKLEPESQYQGPSRQALDEPGKNPSNPPVSCLLSLGSDPLSLVDSSEPAKPADSEPPTPVLVFPTTGAAKTWGLAAAYIAELQETYEAVDIAAEARKALTWINANPTRRKTAKGMAAFLVNWLNTGVRRGDFVRRAVADAAAVEDWRDECKRIHDGKCLDKGKHWYRLRMSA